MATVEQYYQILGVDPNATVQDITRAYRKKAMQLHPDRNKAPDATEQFILLEEAYNYLKNLKEGKISSTSDDSQDEFVKWWYREAENIRQNARRRSKMAYKQVVDEDDEKMNDAVNTVTNLLLLVFTFIIMLGIPVIATIMGGAAGFIISMVIIFITLPVTAPALKELLKSKEYLAGLSSSVKLIAGATWFWAIVLMGLNALLFFNITFNTLIQSKYYLLLFGIMPLGIYVSFITLLTKHKYYNFKATLSFCVFPFVVNILFLLNFLISFNPVKEKYGYGPDGNSTAIRLDNDAYEEYPCLRFYLNDEHLSQGNTVVYTMKTGIFGIKVATDSKFIYEHPDFD